MQNRYIFLDAGGDQFVGRTVGGLTMTDSSFATLPPRLRPEDHAEICKMGWELVLPGFDCLCASFQSIVPRELTCLLPLLTMRVFWHQSFLLSILFFRQQYLQVGLLINLKDEF